MGATQALECLIGGQLKKFLQPTKRRYCKLEHRTGAATLNKKSIGIITFVISLVAILFYRLITWENPDPDKVGLFTGPDLPNARGIGIIEYFKLYFASLTPLQWLLFVIGTLLAIMLIIGIPQLLERSGGDNWK